MVSSKQWINYSSSYIYDLKNIFEVDSHEVGGSSIPRLFEGQMKHNWIVYTNTGKRNTHIIELVWSQASSDFSLGREIIWVYFGLLERNL